MGDGSGWKLIDVMPTLSVGDLGEAVEFYRHLGFDQEWAYPSEEAPTHVGLHCGAVHLMLDLCTDPPATIQRQNLYFTVESIEAFHRRARSRLGESVPDLVEADYGMRDFSLRDPWGHLLTFGESN